LIELRTKEPSAPRPGVLLYSNRLVWTEGGL